MKYLEDELKPLKYFVRDAVIVFACSFAVSYGCFSFDNSITDFFNVITNNKTIYTAATEIFSDPPGF
jgi:hypothetical protein